MSSVRPVISPPQQSSHSALPVEPVHSGSPQEKSQRAPPVVQQPVFAYCSQSQRVHLAKLRPGQSLGPLKACLPAWLGPGGDVAGWHLPVWLDRVLDLSGNFHDASQTRRTQSQRKDDGIEKLKIRPLPDKAEYSSPSALKNTGNFLNSGRVDQKATYGTPYLYSQ